MSFTLPFNANLPKSSRCRRPLKRCLPKTSAITPRKTFWYNFWVRRFLVIFFALSAPLLFTGCEAIPSHRRVRFLS